MMKEHGCGAHCVAYWLMVVGGLNWGLVGLFNWNLVEAVFGSVPWLVSLIYILVGLSAAMTIFQSCCKKCKQP
jgi:uncharacterized membrane protein YuzA (DUF378 family)